MKLKNKTLIVNRIYGYIVKSKSFGRDAEVDSMKSEWKCDEYFIDTFNENNERIEFSRLLTIISKGDRLVVDSLSTLYYSKDAFSALLDVIQLKGFEIYFHKERFLLDKENCSVLVNANEMIARFKFETHSRYNGAKQSNFT